MEIIKLESICRVYTNNGDPFTALTNIDLIVNESDFLIISGPSGSGKTSLLNIMGTLDKPTTGTLTLFGERIYTKNKLGLSYIRHQKIGYIFQVFNLIHTLTTYENIEYALILAGVPENLRSEKTDFIIELMNLQDISSKRPNHLSSGQQQLIAIARALVTLPKLVLADEPTSNLEHEKSLEIYEIFSKLNRDNGMTIVTATHDKSLLSFGTRFIELNDGIIKNENNR